MSLLRSFLLAAFAGLLSTAATAVPTTPESVSAPAAPLVIGDTWLLPSTVLGEQRRINVYAPPGVTPGTRLPVVYMPDGGLQEDFLHVAGLLQVGGGNGTTRPFLLVGIENTERRRDLTGPTENAKDRTIAPRVGGSQAFRDFIRKELMPEIARRYPVTSERVIVGESLAGLFVVETLLREPELFDTYIAIDPSLWWNDGKMVQQARTTPLTVRGHKRLHIATSADGRPGLNLAALQAIFPESSGVTFTFDDWPAETHATIYHPAALKAFRALLK